MALEEINSDRSHQHLDGLTRSFADPVSPVVPLPPSGGGVTPVAELGTPSEPLRGLLEEKVARIPWNRWMSRQTLCSEQWHQDLDVTLVKVAVLPQTNKLDVGEGQDGNWQPPSDWKEVRAKAPDELLSCLSWSGKADGTLSASHREGAQTFC